MTAPEPQAPAAAAETPTAAAAETPVEAPAADEDPSAPISLEQARKLRSENAGLRARAKAAEDAYEAQLAHTANLEWAQVREYAADVLHDPEDLIKAQPDPQSFYDEEFRGITRSRVVDAAKALAADKPWLLKPETAKAPPTDRPIESLRSGMGPQEKPTEPTWAGAIRG